MASRGRKLVLLVGGDDEHLEVTQIVLETQDDLIVVTARDGSRALRLLDVIEPDIVVTDMMMPSLDGFGLLREYKARRRAAPIIATSAFDPYLDHALELGADAVLLKPFDGDSLISLIRVICAGKRQVARLRRPAAAPEEQRLHAIMELNLDRPAPEPEMDQFMKEVAAYFEVPIALFSVITAESQFWTAGCGIPEDLAEARGTPRQHSFCTHAVEASAALVVQDTLDNPFFRDNVLVKTRGLRFYAGVPLIARHGEALGTLCLVDFHARSFSYNDLELLSLFGRRVLAVLEWREHLASPEIPQSAFRHLEYLDRDLAIFGAAGWRALAVIEAARGAERSMPVACVGLAAPFRRLREVSDSLRTRYARSLVGRLGHARLGWLIPGITATEARDAALDIVGPHGFAEAVDLGRYMGAARTALVAIEQALGDAGLA